MTRPINRPAHQFIVVKAFFFAMALSSSMSFIVSTDKLCVSLTNPSLQFSRLLTQQRRGNCFAGTGSRGRLTFSIKLVADPRKLRAGVKASMEALAGEYKKNKKKKVEVFDTEDDLAVSLAKYTADLSKKVIKERGAFSVVLSGGSLIKSLRKLVEPPYVKLVDWSKWHVFWVDERVVPKDHVDSNYKLAFDEFLSKVTIPPGNVHAINDALSAEGASDDYEIRLKQLVGCKVVDSADTGFPKFDLMLLGMGPDGHIASLFPGHPLMNEKSKWITFVNDSPKPPSERITFTFPVINSSAHIALVVVGASKADVVHRVLAENRIPDKLPVQMVSPEGELTWFLDKGAASKL